MSDLTDIPNPKAEDSSAQHPVARPQKSKIGTVWFTLAAFVLLLLLLIIFILQNSMTVRLQYFGSKVTLQFGVAMLIAAVAGSLLTLLVGSARIIQLKTKRKKEV